MPFVKRNAQGEIIAVSQQSGGEFCEQVSEQEVLASGFLARIAGGDDLELLGSDLRLVRVVEDLVELLVDKGVILFTELPAEAQRKVLQRQDLRSRRSQALDLLGDD